MLAIIIRALSILCCFAAFTVCVYCVHELSFKKKDEFKKAIMSGTLIAVFTAIISALTIGG